MNKKVDLTRSNSICPPPETVLLESVKKNECETIRTLINANKSLLTYEYPYTSKTILSIACSEDGVKASTVQTLLELGADIEGNSEWKPLHIAAENRNADILRAIVQNLKPGQINSPLEGNTALHSLIKSEEIKNNEQVFCSHVEQLLSSGINVNQGDSKNLSAIFWAANNGYRFIIKTILEKSVNHVDLDTHMLRGKSARSLILDKNLYAGPLPERTRCEDPNDHIFRLIKQSKQEEFIAYFDSQSLTNPSDFLNMDDGSSTLLQYSCEKCLAKVVKYLSERGANINLTTKNNTKKPVEIVVENGFYEIFQLLLEHPNVELSPDVLCNLMKKFDHPKFDHIDHEQCCRLLLKKLESDRSILDVNGEDIMNNTALHYSLRYGDQNTTQTLLKLGASLATKNDFGVMPIEDIKPELLKIHLDDCIKFNIKNKNEDKRDFEVIFEYNNLIPPRQPKFLAPDVAESFSGDQLMTPETEVIAFMSHAPEFKALLKHPVIVSFLFMKWHKIRFLFYTNLLFYILFVLSLFVYIFTYYSNLHETSELCGVIGQISYIVLNLTFWILIMRESFQITVSPKSYFYNFENYIEIILILVTGTMLYTNSASDDLRKELSSVAILLSAFELVLMIGQHPKFSTNVVMLKTVSLNFFKLLLWYSLLIIAFALSFFILFAKDTNKKDTVSDNNDTVAGNDDEDVFTGPGGSLFKTIVMLTGEFDAGSINFDTYPLLSKSIFTLFVFMITIILLNLLNGLAVSDTQTIKNNAELVGHITRAQHIFYVESMLMGNVIPTSLMNGLQKLLCCFPCQQDVSYRVCKPLARKVCLFTSKNCQLIVLPNFYGKIFYEYDNAIKRRVQSFGCVKSCSDTYLDKETIKRICAIVKCKRETEDKSSDKCVETLCKEIADLKLKMEEFSVKLSNVKTALL